MPYVNVPNDLSKIKTKKWLSLLVSQGQDLKIGQLS